MQTEEALMMASETQVGGNHYKDAGYQPTFFIVDANLDFCSGNIIKYDFRNKADKAEDWRKAKHYCDLLCEAAFDASRHVGVPRKLVEKYITFNNLNPIQERIVEAVCDTKNTLAELRLDMKVVKLLIDERAKSEGITL